MALIHGMNAYIADKVSNMGADGFRVVRMAWFGPWDPKKFLAMQRRNPEIKPEEFEFIKANSRMVNGVGMMVTRQARVAYKGNSTLGVDIQGVTEDIPAINNVQVEIGHEITSEEARRHAPVAFIGADLRNRFFEGVDPLGKSIQVEDRQYEVVGVAKALGSVFGSSQDNFVMIPIVSYFKTYGARKGIRIVAKAIDQEHLMQAEDEIRVLLRTFRHLGPGQDDNFSLFASETFVALWERLTSTIAAMAVGIVSGVHGGRGRGDHEYHAGGGDGADARDRHPQVARRAAAGHYESIPGGIGGVGRGGRVDRRVDRVVDCARGPQYYAGADGAAVVFSDHWGGTVGGGRPVFWHLPGAAGGPVGSD